MTVLPGFLSSAPPARSASLAAPPGASAKVRWGMLVDTTKCIGCRACEEACNEANKLPKPTVSFSNEGVFEETRDTTTGAFTVVNRFPNRPNGTRA